MVVGLAIHNGHTLNLNLAPAIFRKLLRAPLRLQDLCDVHPDVHRSLCQLLQYPPDRIEADMDLSFQVCTPARSVPGLSRVNLADSACNVVEFSVIALSGAPP